MQHLDEGTIHSWLDGALSGDEAARVEAHLAACPECAAAVAEARGFIAASSRILTALDHVPRGVVPAASPVKWYNRAAWRAAAAVLVVAVGTLAVVRNGRNETADRQASLMVDTSSPPRSIASAADASVKPTVEANFSGKGVSSAAKPNVVTRKQAPSTALDAAIGANAAAAPQAGGAVTAQSALSTRVPGATEMDAEASEQPPLRVVGTTRVTGARVTLYEVAPGDTVTLTEASNAQLSAGVATGVATAERQVPRSVEKSATTAEARRSDTSAVAASDSQSPRLLLRGAMSVSPTGQLPVRVEVLKGVTTISWPDVTTGNLLKLSGRMSVDRLKEIKLRIERERAGEAARKKP